MIALDTNILVYAHTPRDPHHSEARTALNWLAASGRSWAIPLPSVVEFARLASHPRILNRSIEETCGALDALVKAPGCQIIALPDSGWSDLREALLDGHALGNLVFDAHIVAVCRANGVGALLTEDRDFQRFRGVRTVRLSDDWKTRA